MDQLLIKYLYLKNFVEKAVVIATKNQEGNVNKIIAFIELITELEDEFNIEIQPTQIPKDTWNNVDNILKMVKNKINK